MQRSQSNDKNNMDNKNIYLKYLKMKQSLGYDCDNVISKNECDKLRKHISNRVNVYEDTIKIIEDEMANVFSELSNECNIIINDCAKKKMYIKC